MTTHPSKKPSGARGKRYIWVIEVTWMRRKGKPVEPMAITTGGILQAIFLAKEVSERLKIPQSWANPVAYTRSTRKEKIDAEG